jgi:pimeloyl-ACP methyl ester carboxylesterase
MIGSFASSPGGPDGIRVRDLEVVVHAAGLQRFPLFAMSQAGAVAVAYAARHPDKVTRLIVQGA